MSHSHRVEERQELRDVCAWCICGWTHRVSVQWENLELRRRLAVAVRGHIVGVATHVHAMGQLRAAFKRAGRVTL